MNIRIFGAAIREVHSIQSLPPQILYPSIRPQVASLSQDQHTGTKELKFYSCVSKTSPTEKHSDGLRRFNYFFVLLFKLRAADAEARHVGHIRHNMEG